MVTLSQNSSGKFKARKRLPDDVREDYGRLCGARYEARFTAAAGTKRSDAERQFDERKAEINARIASLRAEYNGKGKPFTCQQARALAGKWYEWFIARHPSSDREGVGAVKGQSPTRDARSGGG